MNRPLWVLVAAYACSLALRWQALPQRLALRFTATDAPVRFLSRDWFAVITLLVVAGMVTVAGYALPKPGELGRGGTTLSYGFGYGMTGFIAGVFWSLVRVNAGLGSPVRPAIAAGLAFTALGLVLGVSAPAFPRRRPAKSRSAPAPPEQT